MIKIMGNRTVTCQLCCETYPVNDSLSWAPFSCMKCGTLIRVAPEEPMAVQPSRPPARPVVRPAEDDVLLTELPPVGCSSIRRRRYKSLVQLSPAICVSGAVIMLGIVVLGMLIHHWAFAEPEPVLQPVRVATPIVAAPQQPSPEQQARAVAWRELTRVRGEIDENRIVIQRRTVALREAGPNHRAEAMLELTAARDKEVELKRIEATWKAEYERATAAMR